MKKIENKKTEIRNVDESAMTYADLGKVCLNQIPQNGFDVSEMRDRLNVLTKLEKANGTIELEDAEHNVFKSCVNSMKWSMMHKDLVSFIDDVNN